MGDSVWGTVSGVNSGHVEQHSFIRYLGLRSSSPSYTAGVNVLRQRLNRPLLLQGALGCKHLPRALRDHLARHTNEHEQRHHLEEG